MRERETNPSVVSYGLLSCKARAVVPDRNRITVTSGSVRFPMARCARPCRAGVVKPGILHGSSLFERFFSNCCSPSAGKQPDKISAGRSLPGMRLQLVSPVIDKHMLLMLHNIVGSKSWVLQPLPLLTVLFKLFLIFSLSCPLYHQFFCTF